MNPKQKRFCEEYLVDMNATQAAIRAGYSPKTAYSQGSRLLKDDEIQAYVRARTREMEDALIASQTEVRKFLTATMRGETEETLLDKDGDAHRVPVSARDRVRAAELLGKHMGMFDESIQVSVPQMPRIIANPDGSVEVGDQGVGSRE